MVVARRSRAKEAKFSSTRLMQTSPEENLWEIARVEELEARLEGLEGCIPGYDWDDAAGPTSGSAKPVRGSSA